LRDDLAAAFTLLTRLPAARFGGGTHDLARAVWAFPVVGLVVGALGGAAYWLVHALGAPPLLAACWTLAAMLLVTGAFHEDGLADTADGFGGGRTRERKLEIMRDSRIGSYGALALGLSLIMRVAAIAALGTPHHVVIGLALAGMIGRAAMILVLLLLKPARMDGMAAAMGKIPPASVKLGLAITAVAPFLFVPVFDALGLLMASLAASLVIARIALSQIGGHSGDVLGAAAVIVECVALTVIVSALG
jgi:adenosylcobinamide-GDP ribazoletransferase